MHHPWTKIEEKKVVLPQQPLEGGVLPHAQGFSQLSNKGITVLPPV